MLLALAPRVAPRAGRDRRRQEWSSASGRGRGQGASLVPACDCPHFFFCSLRCARELWGEVDCKVSEGGVGSGERGGGRGAGAGRRGQTRSSRRLCSAPGERPGEESPGEDRDCPPRHSGLGGGSSFPPPSPPSGLPHPRPSSRPWSQVSRPPLPHPFTLPTPKTARTQRPSSLGWGRRRDGGEGARWAEYLLKGGCLLWNVGLFVFVFFSLP